MTYNIFLHKNQQPNSDIILLNIFKKMHHYI